MSTENESELASFIASWTDTPEKNKAAFLRLKDHLASKPGVLLDFKPRPEITYSLRATHPGQKDRELFVMVDVIEDDPRWLSVCFFGDMISDPEALGDDVPEGLVGQDATCFDIEEWDDALLDYVTARLDEAYASAVKQAGT